MVLAYYNTYIPCIPLLLLYRIIHHDHAEDIEPPSVICPSDIRIDLPQGTTKRRIKWKEPIVTDSSTKTKQPIVKTASHQSTSYFPLGETTVFYNFTDWSGNIDGCSLRITLSQGKNMCVSTLTFRD